MSKDNPSNPFEMFGEQKVSELKQFSNELLSLKGEVIELYLGDQSENMEYDEVSIPQNSSIFGRLEEVFDRFIVLRCLYLDGAQKLQMGNKIYINAFQIRAMTVLDGAGSLQDIFLNVRDANKVRKIIREKGI